MFQGLRGAELGTPVLGPHRDKTLQHPLPLAPGLLQSLLSPPELSARMRAEGSLPLRAGPSEEDSITLGTAAGTGHAEAITCGSGLRIPCSLCVGYSDGHFSALSD